MERRVTSKGHYFPPPAGDRWDSVSPAALGWDVARLDEAINYSREQNSTALVILYEGKMVVEEYWQGWGKSTSSSIFSAGKSVMSIAIGLAQEQGRLRIQDPMTKHLGNNWTKAPPEKEALVTIRDVLTMTSGLDEQLNYEADTGTKWFYNTPAYWQLAYVIEAATGGKIAEFLNEQIWAQIGARNTTWNGRQVVCSARDMARFGLMILNNGCWQGKDIIKDKAYLSAAINKSQELNQSYGYLWWLNGGASYRLPGPGNEAYEGDLIPSAPPDTFAALGAGDKKIYVVPSLDMVVVRHGGPANAIGMAPSMFDKEFWERLTPAMPPHKH